MPRSSSSSPPLSPSSSSSSLPSPSPSSSSYNSIGRRVSTTIDEGDRKYTSSSVETDSKFSLVTILLYTCFVIFTSIIFFMTFSINVKNPIFKVEFVSVSVSSSQMTAEWNIKFSILNPNKLISIDYEHFNVSVQCLQAHPSVTIVPPLHQKWSWIPRKNLLHANATVRTAPWPRFNATNLVLQFEVNFKAIPKYNSWMNTKADEFMDETCRGMKIGPLSSGTHSYDGTMSEHVECHNKRLHYILH